MQSQLTYRTTTQKAPMNFQVNQAPVEWLGTSLQGYIQATYEQMVKVFGEPSTLYGGHSDNSIQLCWEVQFDNGNVARVYDWKREEPLTADEVYAWHIGGRSISAVTHVHDAFRVVHQFQTRSTWPAPGSVRAA